MAVKGDDRSLTEVISDVSSDFTALLREEMELAKTELRQGFKEFARGVAFLLIAGFILNAGFMTLIASAVAGLGTAMAVWLSALIVGLALAIVGALLLMKGVGDMKDAELKPERTIASLKEDAKIVKERGHE